MNWSGGASFITVDLHVPYLCALWKDDKLSETLMPKCRVVCEFACTNEEEPLQSSRFI